MPHAPISLEELKAAAAKLPRLSLAHLPTPLEELPRFRERLGGPRMFIKRDDCTGVVFGGNKTRHNEFLMAEAKRQGADVVVWGAGIQSNNCRQTAATCNKLGFDCHLILTRATHNDDVQGNLLIDHLMGATVDVVDAPMGAELDGLLQKQADEYRRQGRKPFVWAPKTGRPLAAVSYALAMVEMLEQLRARDAEPTVIYAAAAGATGAGLALARAALGLSARVRLLCPIRWPWDTEADLADVANDTAKLLGLPHRVTAADIDISHDYMGSQYGEITQGGREAMQLLAKTEGILLDPVYTAKAMAGLIDDLRQGRVGASDTLVFLHTGGTPAVFAYRDELMGGL